MKEESYIISATKVVYDKHTEDNSLLKFAHIV